MLQLTRALHQEGRLSVVLGNHDAMMIDAMLRGLERERWWRNGAAQTWSSYGTAASLRADAEWLLHTAAHGLRWNGTLLTHGGAPGSPQQPRAGPDWLWGRPTNRHLAPLGPADHRSVHGHTRQPAPLVLHDPQGHERYYIDLGAYSTGVLCALDLADLRCWGVSSDRIEELTPTHQHRTTFSAQETP